MATIGNYLSSRINSIRNTLGLQAQNANNSFWTGRGGDALVSAQNAITSGVGFGRLKTQNPQTIGDYTRNTALGLADNLTTVPARIGYNATNNIRDLGRFSYGAMTGNLANQPDFGSSREYLGKSAQIGGDALRTVGTVYGLANPAQSLAYSAMGGGIQTALEGNKPDFSGRFIKNTIQSAERAIPMAGIGSITNPFIEKTVGSMASPIGKLATNVGLNIGEGVAMNRSADMPYTGTDLAVDALFPIASMGIKEGLRGARSMLAEGVAKNDVKSVKKAINMVNEQTRKYVEFEGKKYYRDAKGKVRLEGGKYAKTPMITKTTIREIPVHFGRERIGTVTIPSENKEAALGLFAGFEAEYDENGRIKGFNYNPQKGALGLAVGMGVKSGLKQAKRTRKTFKQIKDEAGERLAEDQYQKWNTTATNFSDSEKKAFMSLADEYINKIKDLANNRSGFNSNDIGPNTKEANKLIQEFFQKGNQLFAGKRYTDVENQILASVQDAEDYIRRLHDYYKNPGKASPQLTNRADGVGDGAKAGSFDEFISNPQVKAGQTLPAEQVQPQIGNIDEAIQADADVMVNDALYKMLPVKAKDLYSTWIGKRASTQIDSTVARKIVPPEVDNMGIGAFKEIQSGKQGFEGLRKFFDDKYDQVRKAGVDLGYTEDYIPQLWQNSPEEVQQALGKRLSGKPSFSMDRVFKTYEEGIQAGLTPRFNKVSDLVGWYEGYANKVIADKEFFSGLVNNSLVMPKNKAPEGWVTLDPDRFKTFTAGMGKKEYGGVYSAPEPLARQINNYLGQGSESLAKTANFFSGVRQRILTGGVPGTAINAHGLNILGRNVLASNNPVTGFIKGTAFLVNPKLAEKSLNENLGKAKFFVENGLTISMAKDKPQVVEDGAVKQGLAKIGETWETFFEKPLFEKVIPALKVSYADQVYQDLRKSMDEKEAGRLASKTANNIFGGINIDELGRSKDFQNMLRTVFLAPDWAESNIRIGGNLAKGLVKLRDPQLKAYRTFARNFVLAYITANILNKTLSGKWMFENDAGNAFNVDTNTYTEDGQKRYIKPFGTGADMIRLPYDVLEGLVKGDPSNAFRIVANRLNPVLGSSIHLATNNDYLGRPIYGKDQYGGQIPPMQAVSGIAGEVSNLVGIPNPIREGFNLATGRSSPEQAMVNAFELPIRYKGGAFTDKQKQAVSNMQAEGRSGQDIYSLMQGAKSVVLSDAEKEAGTLNSYEKGILKKELQEKGGYKTRGKFFYYMDGDSMKSIELSMPERPKFTTSQNLNKELLSDYKSALSRKKNDIVKLYELGAITQEQAESALGSIDIDYKSFNKPKKGKITKPKAVKSYQIKGVKTKRVSLKPKEVAQPAKVDLSGIELLKPKTLKAKQFTLDPRIRAKLRNA